MMEQKRKVELLAPAGTPEAFYGAVSAGADAVYLAGNKFGARAYADNFNETELIDAIRYAHLFDVKVYLTINTLFKNLELKQLDSYLRPYYEAGLDGVIVQDLGVLAYVKEHFPLLERHVSTQMTVSSLEGARYLVEKGVKRIVPARELTMEELQELCDQGIEVESFIHGSMCYCYSGQCLFSSIIGGRSGNRGRCAQPCRLPYRYENGKEEYCFSLKDMCTLHYLPRILESGIASLKIEGRMKSPAYAAGVTAVYRKYIERYYQNPAGYNVEKEDLEQLKHLYIRTELQSGYYQQKRSKNMITLQSPAYSKTDDSLMEDILQKYVKNPRKLPVDVSVRMQTGKELTVTVKTNYNGQSVSVTETGEVVLEAQNAPLKEEDICKRFEKSGDSIFSLKVTETEMKGSVFLPVKAMNEARRLAITHLEEKLESLQQERFANRREKIEALPLQNEAVASKTVSKSFFDKLKVFVETKEQLDVVVSHPPVQKIVVPLGLLKQYSVQELLSNITDKNIYVRLPAVCRKESFSYLDEILANVSNTVKIHGFYVNQIDSLAYLTKKNIQGEIIGDINLYAMNSLAVKELLKETDGYTLSLEQNAEEWKHMPMANAEMMLYGRYPLMNTANCVFLTHGNCRKGKSDAFTLLTDRKGSKLPLKGYCDEAVCYNTVYNSVPTSLHKHVTLIQTMNPGAYQIRFLEENKNKVREILTFYEDVFVQHRMTNDSFEYTNGHFKRKVE